MNGFDLSIADVPLRAVKQGGPSRGGIPAIDKPQFPIAKQAGLEPGDRVLGGAAKRRRQGIPGTDLNWHEIVNDSFGGEPVAVTYCPLCAAGIAFDARVGGKALKFGASGLL